MFAKIICSRKCLKKKKKEISVRKNAGEKGLLLGLASVISFFLCSLRLMPIAAVILLYGNIIQRSHLQCFCSSIPLRTFYIEKYPSHTAGRKWYQPASKTTVQCFSVVFKKEIQYLLWLFYLTTLIQPFFVRNAVVYPPTCAVDGVDDEWWMGFICWQWWIVRAQFSMCFRNTYCYNRHSWFGTLRFSLFSPSFVFFSKRSLFVSSRVLRQSLRMCWIHFV